MDIVERMKSGEKISIGMVHTLPLPGTYKNKDSMDAIVERALNDAVILQEAGFDAIIVENVNDSPYEEDGMTVQQIAGMSRICAKIREALSIPIGIDACGDSIAGFGIGNVTGITFIRIPYYVDVRVSARGILHPNGGKALLTRKRIGADQIKIFADIQVKHTYPLVESVPIEVSAKWAVENGADALIVTGASTGKETSTEVLKCVKNTVKIPVVAGSGVSTVNVKEQYGICDGAIIGSSLKLGASLLNPIDSVLAKKFISSAKAK